MKKFDSQTEVLGSDYGQIDNRHVIPIITCEVSFQNVQVVQIATVISSWCFYMHIEYLAVREKQLET